MCHYLHYSYDGKNVKTAPRSNYGHYETSLGKIDNIPIAVGHGYYPSSKKVEALQKTYGRTVEALQAGKWNVLPEYPFVKEFIREYSMVNFKDALYLFG